MCWCCLQSTTRMSLAEENRLVKEIASLKSQKRQLQSLGRNQEDVSSRAPREAKGKEGNPGISAGYLHLRRVFTGGLQSMPRSTVV